MAGTHLLTFQLLANDNPTLTDALATGGAQRALKVAKTFTDGLNVGEVGHVYAGNISLAASATTDLDLYGSLISTVGETVNGSRLRCIVVYNNGPGTLQVSRPNANGTALFVAANDAIQLEEDAVFAYMSPTGKTITNATGDLITLTETSTTDAVTGYVILGVRGI